MRLITGTLRSIATVLASLFVLPQLDAFSAPNYGSSSASLLPPPVQVWDDVFSSTHLRHVVDAVDERRYAFTAATDSFITVYDRGSGAAGDNGGGGGGDSLGQGRTVLEAAIASVLDAIGDDSRYVEYWIRDEWKDLAVHRDIDEESLRQPEGDIDGKMKQQRCPLSGHVLYVDIDPNIRCPTCVFQEEEEEDGDTNGAKDTAGGRRGGPPRPMLALFAVPATSNRLLRFRGDCLHSVPKSALSYFGDNSDQNGNRSNNPRRAVILFNSWGEPPMHFKVMGLPPFKAAAAFAAVADHPPRCKPREEWKQHAIMREVSGRQKNDEVNVDSSQQHQQVKLTASLLGNQARRGGSEADCLLAMAPSMASARVALLSSHDVHSIQLETRAQGWPN